MVHSYRYAASKCSIQIIRMRQEFNVAECKFKVAPFGIFHESEDGNK
jgi:hypothetical protein